MKIFVAGHEDLHARMFDGKLALQSGSASGGGNKCINQELDENLYFRDQEGTEDAFNVRRVEETDLEYVNIVKGTVPIAKKYCEMFLNKDRTLEDIMCDVNNDTIMAAAHEMLEVCSKHLDDPALLTLPLTPGLVLFDPDPIGPHRQLSDKSR